MSASFPKSLLIILACSLVFALQKSLAASELRARSLLGEGSWKYAVTNLQRALDSARSPQEKAHIFNEIGNAYAIAQEWEQAAESYRTSLQWQKRPATFLNLAHALHQLGQEDAAVVISYEFLDGVEELSIEEQERRVRALPDTRARQEALERLQATPPAAPPTLLEQRAILADPTDWRSLAAAARAYAENGQIEDARLAYDSAIAILGRLKLSSSGEQVYKEYLSLLFGLADETGETAYLDRALSVSAQLRVERLATYLGLDCDPVASDTPQMGSILHFEVLPDATYVVQINSDGKRDLHKVAVASEKIEAVSRKFLEATRDTGMLAFYKPGAQLYDWFIRPIKSGLDPESRLTIVTNGFLGNIPWSALYDEQSDRFLVQDHSIQLSLGVEVRPQGAVSLERVVAFGNSGALLQQVDAEAKLVAQMTEGEFYIGQNFTEEALAKTVATNPTIVHISAHVAFDPENYGGSFIDLKEGEIWLQNFGEIFFGKRIGLLVLFGCDTGQLDSFAGIAYQSGVPKIAGTLWAVSDGATLRLTEEFYRSMSQQTPPPEALRKAQLQIMEIEPLPFVWAAFSVMN